MRVLPWKLRARCRGVNPSVFIPDRAEVLARATVCHGVRTEDGLVSECPGCKPRLERARLLLASEDET